MISPHPLKKIAPSPKETNRVGGGVKGQNSPLPP